MSDVLDYVPDDALVEQYADPAATIESLARFYGVSCTRFHARLSANPATLARAQTIKARRCHELSIKALLDDPERIADKDGNMRIDPASVTLQKMRSDGFARIAGVLDYSLSERARVEVEVTSSPLADAFAAIAAAGSSLPIAQHVPRIIEHDPHEAVDVDHGAATSSVSLE